MGARARLGPLEDPRRLCLHAGQRRPGGRERATHTRRDLLRVHGRQHRPAAPLPCPDGVLTRCGQSQNAGHPSVPPPVRGGAIPAWSSQPNLAPPWTLPTYGATSAPPCAEQKESIPKTGRRVSCDTASCRCSPTTAAHWRDRASGWPQQLRRYRTGLPPADPTRGAERSRHYGPDLRCERGLL